MSAAKKVPTGSPLETAGSPLETAGPTTETTEPRPTTETTEPGPTTETTEPGPTTETTEPGLTPEDLLEDEDFFEEEFKPSEADGDMFGGRPAKKAENF